MWDDGSFCCSGGTLVIWLLYISRCLKTFHFQHFSFLSLVVLSVLGGIFDKRKRRLVICHEAGWQLWLAAREFLHGHEAGRMLSLAALEFIYGHEAGRMLSFGSKGVYTWPWLGMNALIWWSLYMVQSLQGYKENDSKTRLVCLLCARNKRKVIIK